MNGISKLLRFSFFYNHEVVIRFISVGLISNEILNKFYRTFNLILYHYLWCDCLKPPQRSRTVRIRIYDSYLLMYFPWQRSETGLKVTHSDICLIVMTYYGPVYYSHYLFLSRLMISFCPYLFQKTPRNVFNSRHFLI